MPTTYYYTVDSEIIGEHTAGQSRIDYLTDAIGSVVATVDQSQTVTSTARYKPYGEDLAVTGTRPVFGWNGMSGYRRTGRPHAQEYVRNRIMSTTDGRWTTVDPMWPGEMAYTYVGVNPVNYTDGMGLGVTDGCPKFIDDAINDIYGAILWIQSMNAGGRVSDCINASSRRLKLHCSPFTDRTLECLRRATLLRNLVVCQESLPNDACGYTPNAPGVSTTRIPGGQFSPVGPVQINPWGWFGCKDSPFRPVCGPETQGVPVTTSSMAYITVLHEMLHACGFNHTSTGNSPPKGTPSCNEIAVCCIFSIANNRSTKNCGIAR